MEKALYKFQLLLFIIIYLQVMFEKCHRSRLQVECLEGKVDKRYLTEIAEVWLISIHDLTHQLYKVLLHFVVWIIDTFDNNLVIENCFEKGMIIQTEAATLNPIFS